MKLCTLVGDATFVEYDIKLDISKNIDWNNIIFEDCCFVVPLNYDVLNNPVMVIDIASDNISICVQENVTYDSLFIEEATEVEDDLYVKAYNVIFDKDELDKLLWCMLQLTLTKFNMAV